MLVVSSLSQAVGHGVFVIERQPPAVIAAEGSSIAAIVDQFPWGPDSQVYTTAGSNDFYTKFAPAGMSRIGGGYMAVAGKSYPILKVVRVLGSTAVAATAPVNKTGPTLLFTVLMKYKGTAGNSITVTTAASTDGDANHFDLTVAVTGVSGTTSDTFKSINLSAVGTVTDFTGAFTNTYLVGGITIATTGVPIVGTVTATGGTDGTIDSTAYVGTQGSGNQGVSLMETDTSIDYVFTGDPGNTLRPAVNAGLSAHADYMTDRMAFINGNSGLSLSAVQTDVGSYRSLRVCYEDNWAYQRDDVDGTQRLVGPAPFAVSVASNLSPSTSFAWKDVTAQRFMSAVVSLETNRGPTGAATNEALGINTLQREALGGFTFSCAVVTSAPTNPNKKAYKRTRMTHYIGKAVKDSLRPFTDSPNVPENQQDEVNAVDTFLSGLKRNAVTNANALPHIVDFAIRDLASANAQSDIDAGLFFIPADVKLSSDQERIFLSLQIGASVNVTANL